MTKLSTQPPITAKPPVSCRFYCGYTIRNNGYYQPDKCVWWEAKMTKLAKLIFTPKD